MQLHSLCGPRGSCAMFLIFILCSLPFLASSDLNGELWKLVDFETGFITTDSLGNLTTSDLYILRPERLSNLSGSELAAVALEHKSNVALFEKLLLACVNKQQKAEFISHINVTKDLSEDVQRLLASTLVGWYPDLEHHWKFDLFKRLLETGSPVLAYLPRTFLYFMGPKHQEKFMYHLRLWEWTSSKYAVWARKSPAVKRIWVELLVNSTADLTPPHKLSGQKLQFTEFLLIGSTPDEFELIDMKSAKSQDLILGLPLDPMQSRAVFASASLAQALPHPDKLAASLTLLTPAQIVQVSHRNFSLLAKEAYVKNKHRFVSWASAAQVAYLVLEEASEARNIKSLKTVMDVGKWIYALPTFYLHQAARVIEDLPKEKVKQALNAIDSPHLNTRQARLLISKHLLSNIDAMEIILELQHKLLIGIPASKISDQQMLPQVVTTHLLSNLPSDSTAISSLFLKVRNMTGNHWIHEAMFNGLKGPQRFAQLMTIEEIKPIALKLGHLIRTSRHTFGWPLNFLRVVAHEIRKDLSDVNDWAQYLYNNPQLISGLTCKDLIELGPKHGVPILVSFGNFLRMSGQNYPKDLRECSLQAMLAYLKNRADLEIEPSNVILLDTLYPSEITAIGGFPFTHVPYSFMKNSKNWAHILKAMSRLSATELLEMLVLPGSTPMLLSQISKKLEHNKDVNAFVLDGMGNLFQFLPHLKLLPENLDADVFRLWLEGLERKSDTALCVSKSARASLWYRLVVSAYGEPSTWSAGTVSTLNGLLIAVPMFKLQQIPSSSMIGAIDQLDANLGYTPEFIKLCKRYLGPEEGNDFGDTLNALMKFLLHASNSLADTVQTNFEKKRRSDITSGSLPMQTLKVNATSLPGSVVVVYPAHAKTLTRDLRAAPSNSLPDMDSNSNLSGTKSTEIPVLSTDTSVYQGVTSTSIPDYSLNQSKRSKVYCGSFQMAKMATTLTLQADDLKALDSSNELVDCLPFLGSLDLSATKTREVLEFIKKNKNLKMDLRDLGKLTSQVDIDTISSSNLTNLDVLATIGNNLQSWDNLDNITELVLRANSVSDSIPLPLAMHLGRLICGEPIWTDKLLAPHVFLKIYASLAHTLSTSRRCPPLTCLSRLIALAEEPAVFGNLSFWSGDHISSMGTIMAGISARNMQKLAKYDSLLGGLQAGALRCMHTEALRAMSQTHYSSLSQTALEALFFNRFGELEVIQQSLVRRALVSSPAHALLASSDSTMFDPRSTNFQPASSNQPIFSMLLLVVTSAILIIVC